MEQLIEAEDLIPFNSARNNGKNANSSSEYKVNIDISTQKNIESMFN